MYDVIGDVHGHYTELHRLLGNMGYRYYKHAHNFSHPRGRRAVFVGDLVDRGSQNKKVVTLVRNMVREGEAHAIMGNHDLNAVHWTMPDTSNHGEFLRKHTHLHAKQHATFLEEAAHDPDFYRSAIDWFKSLPLYLKFGNNHFVHACFYSPAIQTLQDGGCMTPDMRFTDRGLLAAGNRQSPYRESINLLIRGPEEHLPEGLFYHDESGAIRRDVRIAWWREKRPRTYGEAYTSYTKNAAFSEMAYEMTTPNPFSEKIREELRRLPENERVFIGHLSIMGDPAPLSDRVCCVDYGVAKAGKLAAYRITDGETKLDARRYTWVESVDALAPNAASSTASQKRMAASCNT